MRRLYHRSSGVPPDQVRGPGAARSGGWHGLHPARRGPRSVPPANGTAHRDLGSHRVRPRSADSPAWLDGTTVKGPTSGTEAGDGRGIPARQPIPELDVRDADHSHATTSHAAACCHSSRVPLPDGVSPTAAMPGQVSGELALRQGPPGKDAVPVRVRSRIKASSEIAASRHPARQLCAAPPSRSAGTAAARPDQAPGPAPAAVPSASPYGPAAARPAGPSRSAANSRWSAVRTLSELTAALVRVIHQQFVRPHATGSRAKLRPRGPTGPCDQPTAIFAVIAARCSGRAASGSAVTGTHSRRTVSGLAARTPALNPGRPPRWRTPRRSDNREDSRYEHRTHHPRFVPASPIRAPRQRRATTA
jgi:hypothetical protein